MTKIRVSDCPACPELDAAVEEARGNVACNKWTHVDFPEPGGYIKNCQHDKCYPVGYAAQYSTDLMAADSLWDELVVDHWVVSVCYGPGRDGRLYASVQMQVDMFLAEDLIFRTMRDMDARAETKPLAITRAYLKAKGIEYVEVRRNHDRRM
jgi:hypothetical protein